MSDVAYVYVPARSKKNFDIGIERGVWGWRSETLDRARSRAAVASLADGDFLVLGHRGPDPRVPEGGWRCAALRRVIVAQIVRRLYESDDEVWPDDLYPERVKLDILDERFDVSDLSPYALEALRLSANKQGAPVMPAKAESVFALVSPAQAGGGDAADDTDVVEEETDAVRNVLVRREQRRLRRQKFGDATEIQCAICGRTLPARIVHAAHIKRRAAANYRQRMDPANIMAACTLGCDALFEFGHIYVDRDGFVRIAQTTPDVLAVAATDLTGLRCSAFCPASETYFEYHRSEIARVG